MRSVTLTPTNNAPILCFGDSSSVLGELLLLLRERRVCDLSSFVFGEDFFYFVSVASVSSPHLFLVIVSSYFVSVTPVTSASFFL